MAIRDRILGVALRTFADIAIKAGLAVVLSIPVLGFASTIAHAGTVARITADNEASSNSKLLVEADELIYDNDNNTVTARGNAELHFGPRTIQADRVVYNRKTGRVVAEGNVRLSDDTGTVVTGERMELTDDFKSGFIDALRSQTTIVENFQAVRTRISAPRAERINGDQIILENGTYTACEPCKNDPSKPPLWQIKATKIIQDSQTHTIYYEDGTLEIGGIPVAYLPYFESPDPTVKRKTGFLTPNFITSTPLGFGVGLPYFINLDPSYDLTVTPTFLSNQGVLGRAEFRQRLETGLYNVRVNGIFQQTPSAFLNAPLGAGDRDFRGSIESRGRFFINDRWRTGWDITGVSDKYFLNNYRITGQSITGDLFREATSTAFLIGQGDRSWFEARGYYFQTLTSFDWQKEQPVAAPVIDYDKRIKGPGLFGGEVRFEGNLTSLTRDATDFQGLPRTTAYVSPLYNGTPYGLYPTCATFARGSCIVRGLGGTLSRASAQASWRRSFIDDNGQVITPFAYLRGDAFFTQASLSGYQNAYLPSVANVDEGFTGRVMPAIGIDYRYPFVADFGGLGVHTLEPIAQVIVRPNETRIGKLPNEDAQSLIFDDTSLFEWDKFSGYDRVEGGVRANLGGQYSVVTPSGWYTNVLFGESIAIAGVNSFQRGDIANVGLDSGLENRYSDFVGRVQVAPNRNINFISRFRLAQSDLSTSRFETGVTARFAPFLPLETSIFYSQYEAQPALGFSHRREGITASGIYRITPNWFVNASVVFDLTHYLETRDANLTLLASYPSVATAALASTTNDKYYLTALGLGGGYQDECMTVSLQYLSTPIATALGTRERNQSFMMKVELRTLGDLAGSQDLNPAVARDGVATAK